MSRIGRVDALFYNNIICFDHVEQRCWVIGRKPSFKNMQRYFAGADLEWVPDCDDSTYKMKISCLIDQIHAGEVYQVNISRRHYAQRPRGFDAFAHYMHMRDINPAPFSAYANFGGLQISSSSPERFLSVNGTEIHTRPIKGTIPSSQSKTDLQNSKKDRAENLMIVDLMRNDLSKICKNGSVETAELFKIESFEGLHHMVSTVVGRLSDGQDSISALRACFPGGSITGAPKISAMELIEALEPERRGPYCGSMGWIGYHGDMDTNILIRTLVFDNKTITLQTGSGIVADSNPDAELQESLDKANTLFRSFHSPTHIKKMA